MSSPFRTKIQPNSPTFALSAVALLLGLLIGFAWVTNRERLQLAQQLPVQAGRSSLELQRNYLELQREVGNLRAQLAEYEKAASNESSKAELLSQSLENYKRAAGLTALTGPGIIVTLVDSKREDIFDDQRIIHDRDILSVVNELFAAGAEAVAVNGQRIVPTSSIRCIGPVVFVNRVEQAPPYEILALGDTKTLKNGFTGVASQAYMDLINTDPNMVKVEAVDKLTIPAFRGAIPSNFGTVVPDNGNGSSSVEKAEP